MVASRYAISAQKTVRWPQYVAACSAAGGAFAVGAALGKKPKNFIRVL